ncbi:hypothetical protein [Nocardiopsis changdeensis]|uniref:hypothetical protein n=1 Tax=Nocardiopsis changdeensis TaxID=2831969 RepID=UPI003F466643
MTPTQIVRTVAAALIAGGAALGLVPGGRCGAGWWSPLYGDGTSYGWFGYSSLDGSGMPAVLPHEMCEAATAPVASWAIALVVMGAALLAGVWFTTSYTPRQRPRQ